MLHYSGSEALENLLSLDGELCHVDGRVMKVSLAPHHFNVHKIIDYVHQKLEFQGNRKDVYATDKNRHVRVVEGETDEEEEEPAWNI